MIQATATRSCCSSASTTGSTWARKRRYRRRGSDRAKSGATAPSQGPQGPNGRHRRSSCRVRTWRLPRGSTHRPAPCDSGSCSRSRLCADTPRTGQNSRRPLDALPEPSAPAASQGRLPLCCQAAGMNAQWVDRADGPPAPTDRAWFPYRCRHPGAALRAYPRGASCESHSQHGAASRRHPHGVDLDVLDVQKSQQPADEHLVVVALDEQRPAHRISIPCRTQCSNCAYS